MLFFVFVIVKLEHLNNLSKKTHIIIQQLERGQRVRLPIKIKYLANSEQIMTATRQLTLGILLLRSFFCNAHIAQKLIWDKKLIGIIISNKV